MRHWIGGLSLRSDEDSTPVIKPDGRPLPRIEADARTSGKAAPAGTHLTVKSGTRILVAALGHITPTRRSRAPSSFRDIERGSVSHYLNALFDPMTNGN
jgi:hypothetical protein